MHLFTVHYLRAIGKQVSVVYNAYALNFYLTLFAHKEHVLLVTKQKLIPERNTTFYLWGGIICAVLAKFIGILLEQPVVSPVEFLAWG